MNICGYNVLPIVTDPLNLYKYGLVRHGSALVGCCNARRGLVRQGLTTADRELEIVLLRVLGTVGKGSTRRGEAGSGKVWRDEAVPGRAWQGTGNSR